MDTVYIESGKGPIEEVTNLTNVRGGQLPPTYVAAEVPAQPAVSSFTGAAEKPKRLDFSNKGQNMLVSATASLLTYGGMDMAQGLGWNLTADVPVTQEFQYSWFVGVIAGCLVGSLAVNYLPKGVFYIVGGVMNLIDAILFVSLPYNYSAILAARYVGGVGIGFITVPFIIHNSEAAVKDIRGIYQSKEQLGLTLGVIIQVIYDAEWTTDMRMSENVMHGIMGIVFSVIALISVLVRAESPIYYIRRNEDQKARINQRKLLNSMLTDEQCELVFQEAKLYVMEGENQSLSEQLAESAVPFFKLLFYRSLVAFTFSLPLSASMITSTYVYEGVQHSWQLILFGALRKIAALITSFGFLDRLGRKSISLVGLLCMGALMVAMAAIYAKPENASNKHLMMQVCNMGMAFQFFAGMYICSTSCYLAESFPMKIKPYLIAILVCVEHVIHIIVIVSYKDTTKFLYDYFLAGGILLLIGALAYTILLPETKKTTLREARERCQRVFDLTFY